MEQKARMTAKDPAIKVAHQRLSVLQLAEMLGNVSVACKQMGMDRTSFYEWKGSVKEFVLLPYNLNLAT